MKSSSSCVRFIPQSSGRKRNASCSASCFSSEVEGTHFSRPRRMILTQWMASPGLRHQNAGQVRMILKHDAKHVPYFALIPVGGCPDIGSSIQCEVVALEWYFDSDIFVAIEGQQMVNNGEVAVWLAL